MIDSKFMNGHDIVFISETHVNGSLLKHVDGFKAISDPTFAAINSGGMAAYLNTRLFPYVCNIRFTKCTLSFSLSILPGFCFMLVYIYPVDSMNYDLNDFGIVSEEISYWLDSGFTPFLGGDYNARLGDLNVLSQQTLKWRYTPNIDNVVNGHGRLLSDMCEHNKILPLNHCCYYNKIWDGKFTYHKGGKCSQIDYVLTNQEGRKFVHNFRIMDTSWHLSDHLQIHLELRLPLKISMDMLFARAMELNSPFHPVQKTPSCNFKFNMNNAQELLINNYAVLSDVCKWDSPDDIISNLDENLRSILNESKMKREERIVHADNEDAVKECDELFNTYISKIESTDDESELKAAYTRYQLARNQLNRSTFSMYENKYKQILEHGDERKLWSEINWSGKHKNSPNQQIPMSVMTEYFEKLYQPLDLNEMEEMKNLQSDVHIPINDEPITSEELQSASSKMKKGGYDFSLEVLKLLMLCISPLLLALFNLIFYFAYPIKFGMSLLSTIPKKGNLKMLTNYRGIHVQNLLSLLYDRIIANRLLIWAKIHPEQSAFQKGKSTLNHIFLLRIITALAKYNKLPLFIGFFDLAKAFDRVSRPLLLKSLIKLGIGSVLFNAIKAMYSCTKCIIKVGNKLSDVFQTYSGIKQGAPSSVILFVIFMDGFIDVVREKCIREQVIELLHILLHADDTAVLSTNRLLFIKKCNVLLAAFKEKKVSLNLGKSGFLVINPKNQDDRCNIKLESGWLKYCSSYVYLGVIFSDNGAVSTDVNLHVCQRQKSVFVKLANFIRNNPAAPVVVKRKVLRSCLNASLLYGCETWGSTSTRNVETLYRKAIKITFGMRNNTPNEIVFIETGLVELKCEIYKRQYKFWVHTMKSMDNDPHSEISKVMSNAIAKNVHYIRHYKQLLKDFRNEYECYQFHKQAFQSKLKKDVMKKTLIHSYSALDDYIQINPSLATPEYNMKYTLSEYDRQMVTKYKTGSHFLKIATGYFQRTPTEKRKCCCGEIQSLEHVILHCPITSRLRDGSETTLMDFFSDCSKASHILKCIEKLLNIRTR